MFVYICKTRCADHVTPLYPQKLALTSPTGGGRSVGIVRVRTKATEFSFFSVCIYYVCVCMCVCIYIYIYIYICVYYNVIKWTMPINYKTGRVYCAVRA